MRLKPRTLNKLHEKGKLDKVIKIIKNKCDTSNVQSGTQVSTFMPKKNKSQVYKLVPMDIGYFKSGLGNKPKHLLDDSIKMKYFYLPIKDIVYENKHAFLYTQDYVKTIKHVDSYVILNIFIMIYRMIDKDLVSTDISKHNLGINGDNIVVFDIQGLRKYHDSDRKRLSRNIKAYLSILDVSTDVHLPHSRKESMNIIKNIYNELYRAYFDSLEHTEKKMIDMKSSITFE